jgi:endonuclease-3
MLRILGDLYPEAAAELDFDSPYQLVIATVLSAQTTDVRVNSVTPELFAAYPGPARLSEASPEHVEQILFPLGFYRAKTRSVIALAETLERDFGGVVPSTRDELMTLAGVGRKTANVVLSNAFGDPQITVDTHVGRLAQRFGWTTAKDPNAIEADVASLFPKRDWTLVSDRTIWHGRRVCHARNPACGACPLIELCPSSGIGEMDPSAAAKLVTTSGRR